MLLNKPMTCKAAVRIVRGGLQEVSIPNLTFHLLKASTEAKNSGDQLTFNRKPP